MGERKDGLKPDVSNALRSNTLPWLHYIHIHRVSFMALFLIAISSLSLSRCFLLQIVQAKPQRRRGGERDDNRLQGAREDVEGEVEAARLLLDEEAEAAGGGAEEGAEGGVHVAGVAHEKDHGPYQGDEGGEERGGAHHGTGDAREGLGGSVEEEAGFEDK